MLNFPINAIHQVELTSRCNLACVYCVHPTMPRAKIDMDEETFVAAVRIAARFAGNGIQREFNMCGIGESTLHPHFIEFVAYARLALGDAVDIVFATNGVLMTDELARELAPFRPKVGVSLHRPEVAGPAIEILKRHGLLAWVGSDAATQSVDWAGQVDWHVSAPKMECMWVKAGRVFVLADGRVSTCCFDGAGTEVICDHIRNLDLQKHFTRPYRLCKGCHQDLNIDGYEQRPKETIA